MRYRAIIASGFGIGLLWCSSALVAQDVVEVEIRAFRFIPATLTIPPGSTVRWINREKRQYHNVWFEALGEAEPDYLFPDEIYERTFATKGEFPYRCGPHPEMQGIIHVQ